jgi:hypothetical protein
MLFDPSSSNACATVAVANLRVAPKGTAKATFNLNLLALGVVLIGCMLHRHDGREWIALPRDGGVDFLRSASAARRQFQADALAAVHAALAPAGEVA